MIFNAFINPLFINMKIIIFLTIFLFYSIYALAQDNKKRQIIFNTGVANINYKRINNALQTGFSLAIPTNKKINYLISYQYILGANIKEDDLSILGKIFNYNSHVQQNQFMGFIGLNILNTQKINVNILTGLSLNFLKQSYVSNIYLKEIVPNQPFQLVSESIFEKKFQIGSSTVISTLFNTGKLSPGINMQYQFQNEFSFFSPSLILNYKL